MMTPQEHDTDTIARGAGCAIALSALASTAAVALDSSARGSDPLAILQSMVALRDALRDAQEGEPQAVVIGGEAGIGKTRLLERTSSCISWRWPASAA